MSIEKESYLTKNLQYLMNNKKLKSVDLAKEIGASPELIVKLKNGSLINPTLKILAGIANFFDVSISSLVTKDISSHQQITLQKYINSTSYVPIIDWNDIDKTVDANIIGYAVVLKKFKPNVFAIKLDSDYGRFTNGSIIFIDASLSMKNNDYVLVLNKSNSVINIRQIIVDGEYYLQSINPQISMITPYREAEHLIYGIIIGYEQLEFFRDI